MSADEEGVEPAARSLRESSCAGAGFADGDAMVRDAIRISLNEVSSES